jgi:hypothetical protein
MSPDATQRALGKVGARHVASLTDPYQRELWEYRDGTNDDPERYAR